MGSDTRGTLVWEILVSLLVVALFIIVMRYLGNIHYRNTHQTPQKTIVQVDPVRMDAINQLLACQGYKAYLQKRIEVMDLLIDKCPTLAYSHETKGIVDSLVGEDPADIAKIQSGISEVEAIRNALDQQYLSYLDQRIELTGKLISKAPSLASSPDIGGMVDALLGKYLIRNN